MNWLKKIAHVSETNTSRYVYANPEGWLRSQGVSDEVLQYALDDNKFPRKMQKWVALELNKKIKSDTGMVTPEHDFIEIRDWYNHMSQTQRGFDIHRYDFKTALEGVDEWQVRMAEERGEGHARYYTQPNYNAQDLGNGFRMVEVVPDDLKNEGAIMQHCVGDEEQDYKNNVEHGTTKIFSLRDSRGWPHATIEIRNTNEFDIEQFDNDSENWQYDEQGNYIEPDHAAHDARHAVWEVAQIDGKQQEPPINKYRPFLKSWLEGHPEYNPSEDDILSVTPSPELLQAIMNDNSGQGISGHVSMYKKYSGYLDEEDMVRMMSQIINDQGVGWSDDAISDAISKPIINGWIETSETDESAVGAMGNFLRGDGDAAMNREQHNAFIRSLTGHESPDIRRAAYSRMSADSRYRTPEGLQEFMQVALEEPSAKVVAVILPNFFTYPNKDSTDSMEKYRNPLFTPDLFPFATQLSEKFKGEPYSDELHAKIVQGLAVQADPQMIARAVTNRFVGQRLGDGSTYEVRYALENMDGPRFGQVWALLDPTIRKFMLSEETKGYNSMVNKHREVIDQYPGETAMRSSNGGLAPPGHGEIFQPESTQGTLVTPDPNQQELNRSTDQGLNPYMGAPPGFPGRVASNWIKRIAQNVAQNVAQWDTRYPRAGSIVSGLTVGSEIPNMESISSSMDNWQELPGIREIPMSELGSSKSMDVFYAANDAQQSRNLAGEIRNSGWVSPLIIGIDSEGPYILEGIHRFVALGELGVVSFPALVVVES